MAMRRTRTASAAQKTDSVTAMKHAAKRKNIPPAGLEVQGRVEGPTHTWDFLVCREPQQLAQQITIAANI